MYIFQKLVLLGTISGALATPVMSADLLPSEQPLVAAETSGFYFGSLSSVNFLDDTSFGSGGTSISTDYDAGFYSAFRVGYDFGAIGYVSPRLELELGYGTSSVDTHTVSGVGAVGGIDSFGDIRTLQGYVNGYIDVPLASSGLMSAVTPYVGGGAGFMNLELRKQGVAGVATLMDDNDTNFAYHLDAGVGIKLQEIGMFSNTSLLENTTLDIGYRFTGADDFELTARDGTRSSTDFRSKAVTIGLRKQF
ncbi:opacity protein-like surface antigen [Rhizobium subbaraonis]|uniref:Opacity protein-like surface antigen n=1 Tax=Rhizobium subbaraonis TaxID=908946 RepID=A0A285V1U0_9HYPH|nr:MULTISPECIES: outer membrane beta-barrel protein [Rhizobiaceae]ANH09262.1 hypothetical protein shn_34690 [Shinella sp. HZN7]SOC48094.1 opacity protein-like surface antigen [Rhizobium subbaraonis]